MKEFHTGFANPSEPAQEMLLVVNCWLFKDNSYCIARDTAGALQCAFSVVGRRKKELLQLSCAVS